MADSRPPPAKGILKAPTTHNSPSVWKRLSTKILPLPSASSHDRPPPADTSVLREWNGILEASLQEADAACSMDSSPAPPLNDAPHPVPPPPPPRLSPPPPPARGLGRLGFRKSPLANVSSFLRGGSGSHSDGGRHSGTNGANHKRHSLQTAPLYTKASGPPPVSGARPVTHRASEPPTRPELSAPTHRLSLNLTHPPHLRPGVGTPPLPSPSTDALRRLDLVDAQTGLDPNAIRRVRFSLPTIVTEYYTNDRLISGPEDEDDSSGNDSAEPKETGSGSVHVSPLRILSPVPKSAAPASPASAAPESRVEAEAPVGQEPTDQVAPAADKKLPALPPSSSPTEEGTPPSQTAKPTRRPSQKRPQPVHRSWQTRPQASYPLELVVDAYRRGCLSLHELPLPRIETLLANRIARGHSLTTLILSGEPLSRHAIVPVAEMLDLNFGLKRLEMDDCALDDTCLRLLIPSLLYADQLEHLSLARNRKIKTDGMGYLATYVKEAQRLRSLDLSGIPMERKMVRYLCSALVPRVCKGAVTTPGLESALPLPPSAARADGDPPLLRHCALVTLRLDNCALKPSLLEQLALALHFSQVRHLSLRLNRLPAVAVSAWATPLFQPRPFLRALGRHLSAPRPTPPPSALGSPNDIARSYDYTSNGTPSSTSLATPVRSTPSRHPEAPGDYFGPTSASLPTSTTLVTGEASQLPSTSLISLDLSDNELKGGVVEIGRLLQSFPNTLESLSLCNNKVDPMTLAGFAACLSHNRGLRSLDLSRNPACGPVLHGTRALVRALTTNQDLRALYVEDTVLTDEGAIAVAEVFPEIRHLAHLNLSRNPSIGLAGVMALAASIKTNRSLVCLEVTVAPNDDIMSKLSQDIVNVCVQNMERQQAETGPVPQPLSSSARPASGTTPVPSPTTLALHPTLPPRSPPGKPATGNVSSLAPTLPAPTEPMSQITAITAASPHTKPEVPQPTASSPTTSNGVRDDESCSSRYSDEVQTVHIDDLLTTIFGDSDSDSDSESSAPPVRLEAPVVTALLGATEMATSVSGSGTPNSKVHQFHPLVAATRTPGPDVRALTGSPRFEEQNRAIREEEGRVLKKTKEVMEALIATPAMQSSSESSDDEADVAREGSVSAESGGTRSVASSAAASTRSSSERSRGPSADRSPALVATNGSDVGSHGGAATPPNTDSPASTMLDRVRSLADSPLNRIRRSQSSPAPYHPDLADSRQPATPTAAGSPSSGGAGSVAATGSNNPLAFLSRHLSLSGNRSTRVDNTEDDYWKLADSEAAAATTAALGTSAPTDAAATFPRRAGHQSGGRKRSLSWQHMVNTNSYALAGALLEDISGEELKTKLLQEDNESDCSDA